MGALAYSQEPFKFPFKSIPFGDTLESVLTRVPREEVKEAVDATIQTLGDYEGISSYFSGGLYKSFFSGTSFNSRLVKKFTFEHSQWENIWQIDLYFSKRFGSEGPFTLFLVRKLFKSPGGNYENVFNGMKNSISEELGSPPKVIRTRYKDHMMGYERGYDPALAGVWILKDRKVFLLVNGLFLSYGKPEIVYLSDQEWQKYIRSCNEYEKNQERKGGKAAKDF